MYPHIASDFFFPCNMKFEYLGRSFPQWKEWLICQAPNSAKKRMDCFQSPLIPYNSFVYGTDQSWICLLSSIFPVAFIILLQYEPCSRSDLLISQYTLESLCEVSCDDKQSWNQDPIKNAECVATSFQMLSCTDTTESHFYKMLMWLKCLAT